MKIINQSIKNPIIPNSGLVSSSNHRNLSLTKCTPERSENFASKKPRHSEARPKNLLRKKPFLVAIIFTLCIFAFTACPNAQGLHDQPELLVTFEFSGFGDISGNYAIPGNFDGNNAWDNTNTDVVMKNGSGVSNEISVTASNIQFSLVPVNDWTRPWYKAGESEGNGADGSSGMRNFYIDNLDLNAGTATVVVKMQDGTATPTSTAVTQ